MKYIFIVSHGERWEGESDLAVFSSEEKATLFLQEEIKKKQELWKGVRDHDLPKYKLTDEREDEKIYENRNGIDSFVIRKWKVDEGDTEN